MMPKDTPARYPLELVLCDGDYVRVRWMPVFVASTRDEAIAWAEEIARTSSLFALRPRGICGYRQTSAVFVRAIDPTATGQRGSHWRVTIEALREKHAGAR